MHKYFSTILLICLEDSCAKLMETQTLGTDFAPVQTVQKADFIIKVIECPIQPLLWCHCDVGD